MGRQTQELDIAASMESSTAMDDTVLYALYPDFVVSNNLPEIDVLSRLSDLRQVCLEAVSSIASSYIWQHQPFDLEIALKTPSSHIEPSIEDWEHEDDRKQEAGVVDKLSVLYGKVKYGDNIEDEWFVVHLLYEISRRVANISIQVWDSDGQFLLIEAAYSIPRWLKPENSTNRIFIRGGCLHILPLPKSPAEIFKLHVKPSLRGALQVLVEGEIATKAADGVQEAINRRLKGYPGKARLNMHRVRCRVPLSVAQVLKHEPQLVALAVDAFYNRDIDAMKAASCMKKFLTFGPEGEPEMVTLLVHMSRAMYAQLMQQVFQAPKCYPMPPFSSEYQEAEIGMKLACGFEMAYAECSAYDPMIEEDRHDVNDEGCTSAHTSDDIVEYMQDDKRDAEIVRTDPGWKAFLRSLERSGYFKGLLKGSKGHQKLIRAAIDSYKKTETFTRISTAMHAPVRRIDDILALPHSVNDFAGLGNLNSDDDSWMHNGEQELTEAMEERQREIDAYEAKKAGEKKKKNLSSQAAASSSSFEQPSAEFNAEQVSKRMHAFVEKISSFEGAELPGKRKTLNEVEAVSVDFEKLLEELKSAVGLEGNDIPLEDSDIDSEGSGSDMEESSFEEETKTEDESDMDEPFMDEYSDVLEQELTGTTIPRSFVRDGDLSESAKEQKQVKEEELAPINVDANLVKNLLESYSFQHGMPGPASNLLGAMGLQLPENKDDILGKK